MSKFRRFVLICLVIGAHWASAQCPVADFSVTPAACINQKIVATNASAGAVSYAWDFCSGELASNSPTASVLLNSPSLTGSFKGNLVESNGFYFTFLASRINGKIYRLDFGTDINSTPTIVDLGQLGVSGSTWLTVQIVNDGGVYYGFVIDFFNKIYRFQIGTSVTDTPANAELIYADAAHLSTPIDLALVSDGSQRFIFVANTGANKLTRIKLHNSYGEPNSDFTVDDLVVSGSGNLSGVSFLKECGLWYAVVTSIAGGQLTKIFFGGGLTDTSPTITNVSSALGITLSSPGGVSLVAEAGQYYAFVQAQQLTSLKGAAAQFAERIPALLQRTWDHVGAERVRQYLHDARQRAQRSMKEYLS